MSQTETQTTTYIVEQQTISQSAHDTYFEQPSQPVSVREPLTLTLEADTPDSIPTLKLAASPIRISPTREPSSVEASPEREMSPVEDIEIIEHVEPVTQQDISDSPAATEVSTHETVLSVQSSPRIIV